MIEQVAIQRLKSKATIVQQLYRDSKGDWEETFYRVLAKNFGFKVNADAFVTLSRSVPLKILRKNSTNLNQVEALLLGMAGFLELKKGDQYYLALQKEFIFLSRKFDLEKYKMSKAQWKFLRLRPANFPTIRIAQLASVLCNTMPLFEKIVQDSNLGSVRKMFSISTSSYWHSHYSFGKESKKLHGSLGDESIDNILINSVIPTLAAYAHERAEEEYFDRALDFLQRVKPESNSIIKSWSSLGVQAKSAFDTQGLIGQMNEFCKKRNCLNCSVGNYLLKPS